MSTQNTIDFVKEQHRFHQGRLHLEWLIISFVFMGILLRAAWMMVIEHDFWIGHRQQRFTPLMTNTELRTAITDRSDQILAQSLPSSSIGWHPSKAPKDYTAQQQAFLSDVVAQPWGQWLAQHQDEKRFMYLSRNTVLPEERLSELKKVPGVEIFPSQKRFYPLGSCGAQVLGYVTYEQQGAEGVEKAFDERLESVSLPVSDTIYRDAKNRWVRWAPAQGKQPPISPLKLTLDSRIQAVLYQALDSAYAQGNVGGFSAIVLSVPSGDLLGSVSYPSFNPNEGGEYGQNWRFKSLLDLYEVGSVMKPFSMAVILDQYPQAIDFHTRTDPGEIIVQGHAITDVTKRRDFDFSQILIYSSNIGLVKALRAYPPKPTLLPGLKECGLSQRSGLPFDNEPRPIFPAKVKPGSLDEATLSFGYTSQMSLMQLARSYLLFAHPQGEIPPLNLLYDEAVHNTEGFETSISDEARSQIQSILRRVVQEGSARRASQKIMPVAAKTGTAKRVGEHGYEDRYHAFFVGFFPADEPEYILVVHADDPKGKIYGGEVCAPIAKQIIAQLGVLPDLSPVAL